MSVDLKPVAAARLTQFVGPSREDGGDRRKLQVTQKRHFVSVTKEEALELATALLEWVQDTREEEV